MTIDMHRDTSLRESVSFALLGSRHHRLLLPSPLDRSRYCTTRNLPTDNPARAVDVMESLRFHTTPSGRRTKRKLAGGYTRKPALCFDVYWERDLSRHDEISLIDESLRYLSADHLQAIIIGRSDYPKRTHVVVHIVDPATCRVHPIPQPYYLLTKWHLNQETDSTAHQALKQGTFAITIESLRRQDHRLLDLPPHFDEAVRGSAGPKVEKDTYELVQRHGPSTFHTTEFRNSLKLRLAISDHRARVELDYLSGRAEIELNRVVISRRKKLIGEYLLHHMRQEPDTAPTLFRDFYQFLAKRKGLGLFDFLPSEAWSNPYPAKGTCLPLTGFRPKIRQGQWLAYFKGDTSKLPDDLTGMWVRIDPAAPTEPWATPVLETVSRSDDHLLLRVVNRDFLYPH